MSFASSKKDEKQDVGFGASYSGISAKSGSSTLIGRTLNIEGTIIAEEEVAIEGKVKGKVKVNNTLVIGKGGSVNADITAQNVKILGKAEGNVRASDKVEIVSGGELIGNIQSPKIIIAEGALFKGNVNMEEQNYFPATQITPKPPQSETKPELDNKNEKKDTPKVM